MRQNEVIDMRNTNQFVRQIDMPKPQKLAILKQKPGLDLLKIQLLLLLVYRGN